MTNKWVWAIAALTAVSLHAQGVWSGGSWTAGTTPTANNVALASVGTAVSVSGNDLAAGSLAMELARVNNGVFEWTTAGGQIFAIGSNAVLTFAFPEPMVISGVNIFSYWADGGRQGIRVNALEVTSDNKTWTAIADSATTDMIDTASGGCVARFADSEGAVLATGVRSLRVCFGAVENNWVAMSEVEVIGAVDTSFADKTYTVTFLDLDGREIKSVSEVANGTDLADLAPEAPVVADLIFEAWDTTGVVTSDLVVRPRYKEKGLIEAAIDVWTGSSVPTEVINMLTVEGARATGDQGDITGGLKDCGSIANLTDGRLVNADHEHSGWCFGNGATLVFELPYARDLAELQLWTAWRDGGRDGFSITEIACRKEGKDAFTPLAKQSKVFIGLDNNGSGPRYHVVLSRNDGTPLFEGATAIRIVFDRADNDGAALQEVVAVPYKTKTVAWADETWDAAVDRTEVPNLLRQDGTTVSVLKNESAGLTSSLADVSLAAAHDGQVHRDTSAGKFYPIGSSAILQYDFKRAKDLSGLGFWSIWNDGGRDGLALREIQVRYRKHPELWVALDTVPPYAKHTLAVDGNNASYGRYHYEMTPTSGEYFCTDVIGLRLCFGEMDNAWTGFQEIEAFGRNASSGMIFSVR